MLVSLKHTPNVFLQGYLWKKGVYNPAFKRRYFTLSGSTMWYYVDENSPGGTAFGEPVGCVDPEGGVVKFSLTSSETALFEIDERTGQLRTARNAFVDFEAMRVAVRRTTQRRSTMRSTMAMRATVVGRRKRRMNCLPGLVLSLPP